MKELQITQDTKIQGMSSLSKGQRYHLVSSYLTYAGTEEFYNIVDEELVSGGSGMAPYGVFHDLLEKVLKVHPVRTLEYSKEDNKYIVSLHGIPGKEIGYVIHNCIVRLALGYYEEIILKSLHDRAIEKELDEVSEKITEELLSDKCITKVSDQVADLRRAILKYLCMTERFPWCKNNESVCDVQVLIRDDGKLLGYGEDLRQPIMDDLVGHGVHLSIGITPGVRVTNNPDKSLGNIYHLNQDLSMEDQLINIYWYLIRDCVGFIIKEKGNLKGFSVK